MMTGFAGMKKWWSNNPSVSCGLGSLAVILLYWVIPSQWLSNFSFQGVAAAVFSGALGVLMNHTALVFSVLLFFSLYSTCLYFRVWRFLPMEKREPLEAAVVGSWLVPLLVFVAWVLGSSYGA